MSGLLGMVTSPWPSIGMVLLLFGFAPPAVLRIVLRAYPREHPRRAEHVAELDAIPYRRRPLWVAALVPVCIDEGIVARRDAKRANQHDQANRNDQAAIEVGLRAALRRCFAVLRDDLSARTWLFGTAGVIVSAMVLLATSALSALGAFLIVTVANISFLVALALRVRSVQLDWLRAWRPTSKDD